LGRLNFDDYNVSSASPAPQRELSRFRGVTWSKKARKWSAQLQAQGVKKKSLGCFDDEEAAARAYDKAAIEHGRVGQLNFNDYELLSETTSASPAPQRGPSRFRGVSWSTAARKWRVQLKAQGVQHKSHGCFDDEEAAARAYDKAAIKHDLLGRLNFDDYELPETAIASPPPQRELSRFRGVSWVKRERKWKARLQAQGVNKSLGHFDNEEVAARAYDKAAIKHGLLDRLNFDDYELLSETAIASPAPQRELSRFRGVTWSKKPRKWSARLQAQGVRKSLGHLDGEEAAARACDKAAIEHGLLDRLNFEYDPEAEALPECAQSLEFGEPGELVGCQVKCLVDPNGWCPGVLSEYITKGKFKDHYKVRLRSMYVS
jgi:hypothetical protein